ncbi:MAG: GDSL-type esterase/lipase family protein [Alistipes indistinctus]
MPGRFTTASRSKTATGASSSTAWGSTATPSTAMNRNPQIVRQAVPLQPELIILSLGTNDSYGRNFDEAAVGAQVEKLIGLLKEYFPLCPLLLTTPMECWSRVRVKGRYVRKPNPNAERVRDQIVQAAGRLGLPVWDFYAVAGGDGAMERWYRAGLAGPTGYTFRTTVTACRATCSATRW